MVRRKYGRSYSPTIESDDRSFKRRRVDTTRYTALPTPPASDDSSFSPEGPQNLELKDATPSPAISQEETSPSDHRSSPTPIRRLPSTQSRAYKPIFSFLRHEKVSTSSPAFPKRQKLKQLTLDLGPSPTKTCKDCGMTYTLSEKKDVSLHLSYHAQKGGRAHKLSPQLLNSIDRNVVWEDAGRREKIVRITRKDVAQKRKAAEKLLDAVAEELGAVQLSTLNLWSRDEISKCDRYQVLLFLRGQFCIGVLLAERISKARRVTPETPTATDENADSAISATTEYFPAIMGISRIWAHHAFRRSGIANRLLDVTSQSFQPLVPVRKDLIAFSQPTEMGARLARKWFDRQAGWLVYDG